MSIIYGLVGKGQDVILVDYTNSFGNFAQITKNIMKKIEDNSRHSYMYNDQYFFHYINENGITYMCMTETPFSQKLAVTFLEDLQSTFLEKFSDNQINLAINYSLNSQFSNILKDKMEKFSNMGNNDKLDELQQNIQQAKSLMIENIERIIDREEKIELLVKKTTTMNFQAFDIKTKANEYREEQSFWSKMKTKIGIAAIFSCGVVGYLII